jgi:hypothetical protein
MSTEFLRDTSSCGEEKPTRNRIPDGGQWYYSNEASRSDPATCEGFCGVSTDPSGLPGLIKRSRPPRLEGLCGRRPWSYPRPTLSRIASKPPLCDLIPEFSDISLPLQPSDFGQTSGLNALSEGGIAEFIKHYPFENARPHSSSSATISCP